jgi:hypothetical protein
MIALTDSTLNVVKQDTFTVGYTGARGIVTATATLGMVQDLTVSDESNGNGTVTGTLTALALVGNTVTVTVTDTYISDGEETSSVVTCVITVTNDGFTVNLDLAVDNNNESTLPVRQQALCDNLKIIYDRLKALNTKVTANLIVSIGSLGTQLGTATATLVELTQALNILRENLPTIVSNNSKTTVTYGN